MGPPLDFLAWIAAVQPLRQLNVLRQACHYSASLISGVAKARQP
jgi:hypothetical protein